MPDAFETQMATLARHISDKAVAKDTPFTESLDAFKSLTAYYALKLKHRDASEDDEDAANFDNFGKKFGANTETGDGGNEAVRGRRRNGSPKPA